MTDLDAIDEVTDMEEVSGVDEMPDIEEVSGIDEEIVDLLIDDPDWVAREFAALVGSARLVRTLTALDRRHPVSHGRRAQSRSTGVVPESQPIATSIRARVRSPPRER